MDPEPQKERGRPLRARKPASPSAAAAGSAGLLGPPLGDAQVAIAAEGALLQGVAQAVKIVCSFVGVVILVRLLTPADFGIMAMAAPFVGFLTLFLNLGLNQAVVQARELDDRRLTALFVYNLAAAAIIAVALVALAPLIAQFYGVAQVGMVAAFSGLALLVSAISMQHSALASRQMRFALLSAADLVASIVGLVVTIALAIWLRSFWALAIGALAGALSMTLLLLIRVSWKPVRNPDFAGSRDMLAFGANLTGFSVVNYVIRNMDNVLIGRFWGTTQLGLYERSYRIMMFPIQAVNGPLGKIMLPTLARLRDQPERYRRAYVTTIRALALVSMPGIVAAAICSEEVIALLLGGVWGQAAPIFRWLSLAALLSPITNSTGWLFISSNRGRALFYWGLLSAVVTLGAFVAALPWGAEGVAFAFFGSQTLLAPLLVAWATRETPVRSADLYLCLVPAALAAAVAWPAYTLLEKQLGPLTLTTVIVAMCYGAAIAVQFVVPGGRQMLQRHGRMVLLGLSQFRRGRLRSKLATA